MSLKDELPPRAYYVQSDGVYKNLLVHSSINGLSIDELELRLRAQMDQVKNYLSSSDWLLITFGTAFVYRYKKLNSQVANCQKLPAANFDKELIGIDELEKQFEQLLTSVKEINRALKIIITVSPVRHLRDGLAENSLSKSTLRLLAHNISENHANVFYYPSYEIMLDDLRDYRYYKEDMIHPTAQATEYIWQHFAGSFFDNTTNDFINQWQKILQSLAHRPFNPATKEHQKFLRATLLKLEKLAATVDTKPEIKAVRSQIL